MSGHRCGERAFVEFHHVIPVAAGGRPTIDNIQLRCRVHNALEAELYFGATRVGETATPYTVSGMTRFCSGGQHLHSVKAAVVIPDLTGPASNPMANMQILTQDHWSQWRAAKRLHSDLANGCT